MALIIEQHYLIDVTTLVLTMFTDLVPSTFNFLLGEEIHQLAQKLQPLYNTPEESKQACSYALVRAADFYFRMYGYEVEEIDFSKWDARTRSVSEIGCLNIKGYGRVQLIPCGPLAEFVNVPIEAQDNIIAYIPVELDTEFGALEDLEEGVLLGFIDKFQPEIELDKIQDLEGLPEFLDSCQTQFSEQDNLTNNLRELLYPMLSKGWKMLDSLSESLLPQPVLAGVCAASGMKEATTICKTVYIEDIEQSIDILTEWTDNSDLEPEFDVSVKVVPSQTSNSNNDLRSQFLPLNLEIALIFSDGEVYDRIKIETEHEEANLEPLSIVDNTSLSLKITTSNFEVVEPLCFPA
jgi:hypothetical protein